MAPRRIPAARTASSSARRAAEFACTSPRNAMRWGASLPEAECILQSTAEALLAHPPQLGEEPVVELGPLAAQGGDEGVNARALAGPAPPGEAPPEGAQRRLGIVARAPVGRSVRATRH